jgi:sugar phosphate isomerase/epimerase
MQIGIFAKTFSGSDPLTVLRAAKTAGYDCVQYNMACSGLASMPDEISDAVINDIQKAVAETGVAIVALSATYNMIHPDISVRAQGLRRLAVLSKAAKALDIPLLTLCTGTRDPDDQWRAHPDNDGAEAWRDLHFEMGKALQATEGVALGIEPELANVVNGAAKAARLIDELKSQQIKIVFDPANLFEVASAQHGVIAEAIALLSSSIAIVHAKDRYADGRFATAGKGVLDYPHFLDALKSARFDGPIITHGLAAEETADVARFLSKQIRGKQSDS